ncbi:hypothetical protein QYE76_031747 [Lolium multiflorum]|uniref:CCHC-type domain-containing protein n=1 Tax=Lolium multiflorum TaxID=4521 RepID=A0AAD8VIQ7_LOLMU|nr:hypothetical protein QYE76_031747 [Lolium multiflorum]
MDSIASHPPGFSRRWEAEGSASASSGSPRRNDHVSGLGLSSASSGESVAPCPEPRMAALLEERARVQDRLVWEQPRPSKGKRWTRRIEARHDAGAAGWGAPSPGMAGLCFRCFLPGHRKVDCTNAEVCLRCWQRGHPAKDCKRPRSPSPESEEELRMRALAKLARRGSPVRGQPGRLPARGMRPPSPPPLPPPPPPPPMAPALPPPPPGPPPVASRLPPMEAWPPLAVEQGGVLRGPGPEQPLLCVVRRSAAMCDLEQRLRFALAASVGGRRPVVSCEQVAAALRWRGVPEGAVSVHSFAPEDFLVICESEELRSHVAGMPSVLVAGAPLSFRQWNRQAHASLVPLKSRVLLAIEGLPPHAWDTAVVEDILGKSCAVDEIAPETKARSDLSLFKLTAWTSELEAIPVARRLAVPEPIAGGGASSAAAVRDAGGIKTLQYRVLVHLVRVEEEVEGGLVQPFGPFSRGPAGSRDGGGEGDGGGRDKGAEPRRVCRDLPWTRGVPDRRRGPGGGEGAAQLCSGPSLLAAAPAPAKSWALPRVCSPAPLTVQTPLVRSSLAQAGAGKAAGPVAGSAAFGQQEQAAPGKAADLAARSVAVGQRVSNESGKADKRMGPAVLEEVVPFVAERVEVREQAGHAADQVLWEDAPDSLPCADPEPVAPACVQSASQGSEQDKTIPSPSLSSVGSTDRSLSTELEEACDSEMENHPVRGDQCV